MRAEQKVHERGFLCVSLWVCNEQSRLKFFSEMAIYFFLAKVLAKVYVDISEFTLLLFIFIVYYVRFML